MKCTLILTGIAMLCCLRSLNAQTKFWDGGGGDDKWSTPANWSGNSVPGIADDVLLDNSLIVGSYIVTLPATPVTIKRLTLTPSAGNTIRLVIPSSNMATPALTASGPGYGILINNGGIFQHSSGLTSGTSLIIADSIRINNGGRYIHNTRTAHAANIVQLLSKASGTENGTFEFDIPSGTGTLSMSNRVYGNLVLSSSAAGGARTYTCSGSNTLTINGDLIINAGVTLSVDLATANGNIIVKGNLVQNGGTLNLASGAGNSTILKIAGDISQTASGQITESNTGSPSVELNGTAVQNISLAGTIINDVSVVMNNPAGAVLLSPLSLPYKLVLQKGELFTSATSLLTLQNACTLQADSLSGSFINGPLKKTGLSSANRFLFPVGKNNMHRWLELKNATGNFTVEYNRVNPYSLSYSLSPDLHHISGLEYWTVKADASPVASAIVKLSFDNMHSGGITDLSRLMIARLNEEMWTSLGSVVTTGTAGTNGSITATAAVTNFSTINSDLFTLATDISSANPLPLEDVATLPVQPAPHNALFTKLISVAPSVVTGTTTLLTVLSEKYQQLRIVVANYLGQPVRTQMIELKTGNNKIPLDVSTLSGGTYYITGYTFKSATNTLRCIKQ